ncbi:SusC/RagA family TonB-linked outer membrane protein [Hymenobacter puniceus]|uniref:SusC/RagA family TonB-linked outer membrane protein n=1 Tax=Hymenobacter sp. BT190 TaxID=2763505 RepID=UPI0016515874|nr:TonB-dependent receptor [Hymenobacter sp. BT190]MBC6700134.1 TonB-dependent receptor [Hymenobacter sp. BT190]
MIHFLPSARLHGAAAALLLVPVSGVALAASPAPAASLTSATVQADITVKGRVVDDKGSALPGVTVVVKGTTIGTSTSPDGTFALSIPATVANPMLSISYIGFAAQEVAVDGRTDISVTLREDAQRLNEVVVIAYGEQSQKTLTSAVTQIDGEAIGRQTVATPGEALAALAPGVAVQSDQGGAPGAPPTIVIRGGTSLGTSSDPLYVVDGYPLQDAAQFNLINPNDIEAISVLKDAASTAIYGSRAANGVVIVTTKRGKSGQTRFTLSSYTGIQRIAKKLDVLGRDEYIDWQKDRVRQQNFNPVTGGFGTGANPLPPVFLNDPGSLPDTDWQDEIYRDAVIRSVQLSASGGTEKARFNVSGAYFKQDGVLLGSSFDRFNLRFNLDANLTSKLKIGVSVAPSLGIQDRQAANGAYNQSGGPANNGTRAVPNATSLALLQSPALPVFIANGDYGTPVNQVIGANNTAFYTANVFNPRQTVDLNQNTFTSYRVFANTFLEYSPLPGLRLKTAGGGTLTTDNQSAYIPATLASEAARGANLSTPVLASVFARESSNQAVDFLWENTATYTKQVGDHNFGLLGLFSLQKFQARNTATTARPGTISTDLLENPLASPDRIGELSYDQNAFLSYGGRLTYDFRKKYLLSAALRTDASSRFGPNNRYAVFPSASLGWRVSEEDFWQGIKPVMNELKFRASIGQTGNANIGSFNYLNSEGNSNYSFGGARVYGYSQRGLGNPDLTWEKNQQTDLGIDAGFFGDKITLVLDYYNRETTGMLLNQSLPGAFGFATSYRTNIGGLRNRGLELALGTTVNLGPVRWNVNGNISGNRTKVLDLGGVTSLPAQASVFGWNNSYQLIVGEPLGDMYGFEVQGVFKNQADLDTNAQTGNKSDRIGNWIIKDQNGDGKIDEGDRTKIGQGVPDFLYGLNQTFTYKAFDLSLSLQGVQGRDVIMGNIRQFYTLAANGTNITRDFYKNTWSPDAPDVETTWPRISAGGFNPGNQLTDRQVYDGSFLRVRNLTFGYTLPAPLLKRVKLQTLRLYLTGQNLFTFTRYPGYDPETSINGGSLITPGLDQSSYPGIRVFTGGLTVGF